MPQRVTPASSPRCVVCHDAINGDAQVRIRGMHIHRRCASYKLRSEPRARR